MPEHSRLAIGVIGCGAVAQLAHIPVLAGLAHVELVALADADPARLAAARSHAPHARTFATAEALLDHGGVDAVVIALPTGAHARCAMAAFERGKHVYLEKPLASNVADGRRVVEAWRRSGATGGIGFNYRRNALYAAAASRLAEGAIGRPLAIRAAFSAAVSGDAGAGWRSRRATGGGVLLDLASHHVDLVRQLSGCEVERVSAEIRSHVSQDDTAAILLSLRGGMTAELFVSLSSAEVDRFEVYGTEGRLVVDRYRSHSVVVEGASAHRSPRERVAGAVRQARGVAYALSKLRAPGREPSYRLAMADFVAAVLAHRTASPDLADGLASLAVIEAAESAALARCAVDVAHDVHLADGLGGDEVHDVAEARA